MTNERRTMRVRGGMGSNPNYYFQNYFVLGFFLYNIYFVPFVYRKISGGQIL